MKLRVPYPYFKALSYAMADADVRPYFNGVVIDPVRATPPLRTELPCLCSPHKTKW